MVAAVIGGVISGATFGFVGHFLPVNARIGVATLLALAVAAGAIFSPQRLPELNRETQQSLLHRGPVWWALINGGLLGVGFTSRIGYWIWYLVPLTCMVTGSAISGAAIWAAYALTRVGIICLVALWMHHHPARKSEAGRFLLGLRDTARHVASPTGAAVAVFLGLWLAY